MGVKALLPIDRERMKTALKQRGMTMADASRRIGFGDNAISGWCYDKKMPKYAAILLESVCGIPRSEYEVDAGEEKKEPSKEPKNQIPALDYERLAKVIYDAVYTAVKKAWENE